MSFLPKWVPRRLVGVLPERGQIVHKAERAMGSETETGIERQPVVERARRGDGLEVDAQEAHRARLREVGAGLRKL
ncbi:hypothetical protein Ct61P_10530 [Colletotrichum tofieldiae]|nr:hypothetical protein Ct61P_10530 [Colletotrichum tofieldiae]